MMSATLKPSGTLRTQKALNAIASLRETDPTRPWAHHDPLISECVKLEMDLAAMAGALRGVIALYQHRGGKQVTHYGAKTAPMIAAYAALQNFQDMQS